MLTCHCRSQGVNVETINCCYKLVVLTFVFSITPTFQRLIYYLWWQNVGAMEGTSEASILFSTWLEIFYKDLLQGASLFHLEDAVQPSYENQLPHVTWADHPAALFSLENIALWLENAVQKSQCSLLVTRVMQNLILHDDQWGHCKFEIYRS